MLISPRMRKVLPLFVMNGISISIYSGSFVNLMTDTMSDKDWSENQKLAMSLFAMIPLGIGELLGSAFIGPFIDRYGNKKAVIAYASALLLAYLFAYAYLIQFKFNLLVYFMTLFWGFQDSI